MGFFNKIAEFFSASGSEDDEAYWIYVRCNRCGEDLRSRVNLLNDLSVEYVGENDQMYHCRKTIVGGTGCFQRIEVSLNFDKNRNVLERQISGGEFIDRAEYSPKVRQI